jgi:hypothetical protein
VPLSASERQRGGVLGTGLTQSGCTDRADGGKCASLDPILPYRPLPFLGVIAGQTGQMSRVASLANPLVRGNFASVRGKIGSPKNKLPLPAP